MPEKRLCNQNLQPIRYNTHTHQIQSLFELAFRLFSNPSREIVLKSGKTKNQDLPGKQERN